MGPPEHSTKGNEMSFRGRLTGTRLAWLTALASLALAAAAPAATGTTVERVHVCHVTKSTGNSIVSIWVSSRSTVGHEPTERDVDGDCWSIDDPGDGGGGGGGSDPGDGDGGGGGSGGGSGGGGASGVTTRPAPVLATIKALPLDDGTVEGEIGLPDTATIARFLVAGGGGRAVGAGMLFFALVGTLLLAVFGAIRSRQLD